MRLIATLAFAAVTVLAALPVRAQDTRVGEAGLEPADARRVDISPTGEWVFLEGPHAWGERPAPGKARSLTIDYSILDSACLSRRQPWNTCILIQGRLTSLPQGIAWSDDGRLRLFTLKSVRVIALGQGPASAVDEPFTDNTTFPATPGLLKAAFAPKAISSTGAGNVEAAWGRMPTALRGLASADFRPAESPTDMLVDGGGGIVGWTLYRKDRLSLVTVDGCAASLPGFVASTQLMMPDRVPWEGAVAANGSGFTLWSGEVGYNGYLVECRRGVRRVIPVPKQQTGPLRPVFLPVSGRVVGMFDFDGVHGLADSPPAVALLDRAVKQARQADPGVELLSVDVDERMDRAVLRFKDVRGGIQSRFLDLTTGRFTPLGEALAPSGYVSAPVRIGSDGGSLLARLYSLKARTGPARGLIITLHGGPQANMRLNGHAVTRRMLALGYDVLDVDYRGSTGYGAARYQALRAPLLMDVMGQDLAASVAWARAQPAYARGPVGVYGTSFGGLAGVVAADRPIAGLDFAIMDSGLIDIDWSGDNTPCKNYQAWGRTLFGAPRVRGQCGTITVGAFDRPPSQRLPILLYVGDRDRQTLPRFAERWFQALNANGGCGEMLFAAGGGHTLGSLPGDRQARAGEMMAQWLGQVEAGKAAQTCGRRLEIPAAA